MSLQFFPLSPTGLSISLDTCPINQDPLSILCSDCLNQDVTSAQQKASNVIQFVEKLIQVLTIVLAIRVALVAMIRNNEIEQTTFGVIVVVFFLQIIMTVNRDFAIEYNDILLDALIGCIGGSIIGFEIRQPLAPPLGAVTTIIAGAAIKADAVETTLTALATFVAIVTLIKLPFFHTAN